MSGFAPGREPMSCATVAAIRPCGAVRLACVFVLAATAACGSGGGSGQAVYRDEQFAATSDYSHHFAAPPTATCEAARRALLSQGYVIVDARPEAVEARKTFQPDRENHTELSFRITCVADGDADNNGVADAALLFANAEQTLYTVKKTSSAASVGVGAVGSISLPIGQSQDSLIKIGAETVPAGPFYQRFFALVQQYLGNQRPKPPVRPAPEPAAPPLPAVSPVTPPPAFPATPVPAPAVAPPAVPPAAPAPAPAPYTAT